MDAPPAEVPTLYDLIANVTHESTAGTTRDKENTVWKVQVRAGKWADIAGGVGGDGSDGEKWFQMQDLIVEEVRREILFLGETVLQVCGSFFRVVVCLNGGILLGRFGREGI